MKYEELDDKCKSIITNFRSAETDKTSSIYKVLKYLDDRTNLLQSFLEREIEECRACAEADQNGSRDWWLARASGIEFALIRLKETHEN